MFDPMNPEGVAPPARKYIHTMTVPSGYKLLSISGQVGTLPDGSRPDGSRGRPGSPDPAQTPLWSHLLLSFDPTRNLSVFAVR